MDLKSPRYAFFIFYRFSATLVEIIAWKKLKKKITFWQYFDEKREKKNFLGYFSPKNEKKKLCKFTRKIKKFFFEFLSFNTRIPGQVFYAFIVTCYALKIPRCIIYFSYTLIEICAIFGFFQDS